MKILLLSLILLFSATSAIAQQGLINSLEDEIQKRMDEYRESNVTVAQDILDKYVNDQVMGMILEKQTNSPVRLVAPSDANMAVLRSPFVECTNSMQRSMRHHQNSILEVRLIEYGVKENPNNSNFDQFFMSIMMHESVPNALVSICLKNKTKTPSVTFIVFNATVEGQIVKTYKNRYKI
ncbi:MAG: hypothetical protein P8M34_15965 [Saprospiraceae bacterium]|nr:hypothetical protein [Saprospiraceae bacterium]